MRKILKVDPRLHIEDIEDVLSEPKIIRVNEFNEDALKDFEEDMDEAYKTGQPVVPIVIDSFGGEVYAAMGMVASVLNCKVPVATIITSKAMSAGAVLFSFGTEGYRFMHPDATLMIHDASSCSFGKVQDVKVSTKHLEEVNKRMFRKMAIHLGHPRNYILDLIASKKHVDWYLTAKEAVKHNIANHMRIPNFEVEITLNMKFE